MFKYCLIGQWGVGSSFLVFGLLASLLADKNLDTTAPATPWSRVAILAGEELGHGKI